MIVQCPECGTKMKVKPPADTKPGTKVQVTCRCRTKLRFTMPDIPKRQPMTMDEIIDQMSKDIFRDKF